MTEHPATDALWAANQAAAAFLAGRIELGAAFARIALQAHRAEQQNLGPINPTPISPALGGPVPTFRDAQTALFGEPQGQQLDVPPSARCKAQIRVGLGIEECHKVVTWQEGQVGDATHLAMPAGWYHIDGTNDHEPVVDLAQ